MTERARGAAAGAATTEEIRSHFPALERVHGGFPVAYFDGPGGTQVPRAVVEAMADYLYHHNANTHWAYPTSAETDELLERSRQSLADFLGAAPDEIAFGANATTLAFHVSRTLGRTFEAGDEVVVTELDHHANVAPWQALERERGVVVRVVRERANGVPFKSSRAVFMVHGDLWGFDEAFMSSTLSGAVARGRSVGVRGASGFGP